MLSENLFRAGRLRGYRYRHEREPRLRGLNLPFLVRFRERCNVLKPDSLRPL
jgi:hypothetical protein